MNEITKRYIKLFEFLKEYSTVRTKTPEFIEDKFWSKELQEIPVNKEYISINYMTDKNVDDDVTLLSVKKPSIKLFDKVPAILEGWLDFDVNDLKAIPKVKNNSSNLSEEQVAKLTDEELSRLELFNNNKEREVAFKKFTKEWEAWKKDTLIVKEISKLYDDLCGIYTDMQNNSENELLCGNIFINIFSNKAVNHPILLKKVYLEFADNTISIKNSETESSIYSMLLSKIEQDNKTGKIIIRQDGLKSIIDYNTINEVHPLDPERVADFANKVAKEISFKTKKVGESDELYNKNDNVDVYITEKPIFFMRRKITGLNELLKANIDYVNETGKIADSVATLVGLKAREHTYRKDDETLTSALAACSGEDRSIILPLPANREQLEIARRAENEKFVLVQGPPGTGKTHTIANLISHYIANGESVLVTSAKKKALSVLKEKIPAELRHLCVSLLEERNKDMMNSIKGIVDYINGNSLEKSEKEVEELAKLRKNVINALDDVRKNIFAIKKTEIEPLVYNNEELKLSEISKFLHDNEAELKEIIPGKIEKDAKFPLLYDELAVLYGSNDSLTSKEEKALDNGIPDIENIPLPVKMKSFWDDKEQNNLSYTISDDKYVFAEIKVDFEKFVESNLDVDAQIQGTLELKEPWMHKIMEETLHNEKFGALWFDLVDKINDANAYRDSIFNEITLNPMDAPKEKAEELLEALNKVIEDQDGLIFKIKNIFGNDDVKLLEANVKLNGKTLDVKSKEACEIARKIITLDVKNNAIAKSWNGLFLNSEIPAFYDLSSSPEEVAQTYVNKILASLNWLNDIYKPFCSKVEAAGIDLAEFNGELDNYVWADRFTMIYSLITNKLNLIIKTLNRLKIEQEINEYVKPLQSNGAYGLELYDAYIAEDYAKYHDSYNAILELQNKEKIYMQRRYLLESITRVAPEWAQAVKNRKGIHGEVNVPENIEKAWLWKQYEILYNSKNNKDSYDACLKENKDLVSKYRLLTEKYAASSAWHKLLLKAEDDTKFKSDLTAWQQTVKRIGKGTGKNAHKYRKKARELMKSCQDNVPVWIMTVDQVYNSFIPGKTQFDVLIIDEASQCGLLEITLACFAKKIIIVGDDKQVSPLSIGTSVEAGDALRNTYLEGNIKNAHLYDEKCSLYDIAAQNFNSVMLKEHFRCVPDIIGYSNMLSYNYEIKPLRDKYASNLSPAVKAIKVDGVRLGNAKLNYEEAIVISRMIKAMTELEEYSDKSIGVITLLGDDQANLIKTEVLKTLDMNLVQKHNLRFGKPSEFQGDERDVIFLSMVDSNEIDENGNIKPAYKRTEGPNDSYKKIYNVAVSRAKDQVIIVHSLDPNEGLKDGDLRKQLLKYAENPKAYYINQEIDKKSESPFEKSVAQRLKAKGYRFEQQYEVGAYRLDIVVIGEHKKVVIECDGDSYHSGTQKIKEDMERQAILERTGWNFIRIRGSEFYRDPDAAMNRVYKELHEHYHIEPGYEESVNTSTSSLFNKLLDKTLAIREGLKDSTIEIKNKEEKVLVTNAFTKN